MIQFRFRNDQLIKELQSRLEIAEFDLNQTKKENETLKQDLEKSRKAVSEERQKFISILNAISRFRATLEPCNNGYSIRFEPKLTYPNSDRRFLRSFIDGYLVFDKAKSAQIGKLISHFKISDGWTWLEYKGLLSKVFADWELETIGSQMETVQSEIQNLLDQALRAKAYAEILSEPEKAVV